MKKYQDNFPHTETECSGTFCIFTYIDNLGGVKKPRGVQRGPARSHLHRVYRVLDSMCKIYKIYFDFFVLLQKIYTSLIKSGLFTMENWWSKYTGS